MKKPTLKENFKAFCDTYMSEGGCPLDWEACWNYLEPHLKKVSSKKQPMSEEEQKELLLKAEEYNSLFPEKTKIPTSGKYAKSNLKEVSDNFKWFFTNFPQFDWNTILDATVLYVEEYRVKNWNYLSTSSYVIRKQQVDKTWRSILADYCQQVLDGAHFDDNNSYKEKVV